VSMLFQPMPWEFPVDALPEVARAACSELAWMLKVTPSMTGSCVIPAMAISVQDKAVVKLPNGKLCPLMVFSWTNAESGSGKTPTDHAIFKAFREHDLKAKKLFEEATAIYKARIRAWNAEDKALQKKLRMRIEHDDPADDARRALQEHASRMPSKPRLRQILYQNVSEAALHEALAGQGESVAIVCDEASDILKSDLMANTALQNTIWSGADNLPVTRAYGRFIQVSQPLMTQPDMFEKLMSKRGDALRASGYFARFLFAKPMSTKGYRQLSYTQDGHKPVHLTALQERFRVLLRQRDERYASGHVEPEVLELSDEAKGLWVDIHNANEDAMRPGAYLELISDFGSKLMENLGRIAAIMHLFDGQAGPISIDTLQRASVIMNWYQSQFIALFGPGSRRPQVVCDADKLLANLRNWWLHTPKVPFSDVQRNAPIRGARFEAALSLLQVQGIARVNCEGKKRTIEAVLMATMVPDYSVLSPTRID
jgi:hypothetical protein